MLINYMKLLMFMASSIWNNKLSGVPGALYNLMAIVWNTFSNRVATICMLGNIKRHGKNILVMRGCVYRYPQYIEIDDSVIIGKHTSFTAESICDYDQPNSSRFLKIGTGVSIGNECDIDFTGGVFIGSGAHIAHYVQILTHDHGYDYRNKPVGRSLEIGEGAFVGSKSIILHNCKRIGNNAVIGIGSVVTKDVPDNAIVAGNPAKVIKGIGSIVDES